MFSSTYGLDITDYGNPADFYRELCGRALVAGNGADAEKAACEALWWKETEALLLPLLLGEA